MDSGGLGRISAVHSQTILTLVWRSERDGLRCELVIKVPGVYL